MLTALDETLLHQAPVTFDQTRSSDHRFFDRMWLGGHCAENIRFLMGMAVYKNTNTVDGYFTVLMHGKQYNLRASRPLLPHPTAMEVGPIKLEIVRPLQEMRLIVQKGPEHPFSVDLNFVATVPVRLESPHLNRVDGRLVQDYVRFDQHGYINGSFCVDDARVEMKQWFGARDHSWGVRPSSGGYEPATSVAVDDTYGGQLSGAKGWFAIYLFFETPHYSGYIQHQEDGDGRLLYMDGSIGVRREGSIDEQPITSLVHDLQFVPGTRTCSGGELRAVLKNGTQAVIQVQSLLPGTVYKGTGYDNGFNDERGLGLHRGHLIEADVYDVSDVERVRLPDGRTIRPWHRELPCTVTVNGENGMGYAAVLNNGRIRRYDLSGEFTNKRTDMKEAVGG
ncbi:MAG TPA: hypothetical protein VJS42_04545 [Steroidobacteraceae bacterium]|nr:hypothetical protein [Steroidobacteraceae bacterium]